MTELLQNRYRIDQPLGMGGMGMVYRGYDQLLSRTVAIKLLSKASLGTEGKARLLSEARAAAQLSHPNIMVVHDAGETEDGPFIVMELLAGETLRQHKPADLAEVVRIFRQMCAALAHAHAAGIIHRDLKPENVMRLPSGDVKLMDFGLARSQGDARQTEEGVLAGTLLYMAPELLMGQPASVQSDLYALGVMVYELACGQPPFQGENLSALIYQTLQGEPRPPKEVNPDVPEWLNSLLLRLLAKPPEERPESAAELSGLIEAPEQKNSVASPAPAKRHNLPEQLTSFIGREREIGELRERILSQRLVTLTGAGGTGKTRLGLQVSRQVLEAFADGVWLVELAPVGEPALVSKTVAAAFGLQESASSPAIEMLCGYLEKRNVLLMLDNCEHLLAECARLADTLLRACPKLRILATSREILNVPGEYAYRVPSLALADLNHLPPLAELAQMEAPRLFVERAAQVAAGFHLDEHNAHDVALICQRLDGIPLAIELAAARVGVMPVELITARLNNVFRLLTGGARTVMPRQQTLRATIDWSYALLSGQEKQVLQRLSVFAGNWTLEGAEQVCSDHGVELEDVLDLLTELVKKSLVAAPQGMGGGDQRYRMLETIRQYAHDKLLESGEGETIRDRHLAYYLRLGKQAELHLMGIGRQVEWINRMDGDLDNLRLALEWALSDPASERLADGMDLFSFIAWFWMIRNGPEGIEWGKRLLEAEAKQRGSQPLTVGVQSEQHILGWCHAVYACGGIWVMRTGSYEQAQVIDWLKIAEVLCRQMGDAGIEALVRVLFARVQYVDSGEARRLYAEVLSIAERIHWGGLPLCKQMYTHLLSLQAFYQGDVGHGLAYLEGSLTLSVHTGNVNWMGSCLFTAGEYCYYQGDYIQGKAKIQESIQKNQELGSHGFVADNKIKLLRHSAAQEQLDLEIYSQAQGAMEFLSETREWALLMNTYEVFLLVAWNQGHFTRVEALAQEMSVISHAHHLEDHDRVRDHWLGRTALSQKDLPQARQRLISASPLLNKRSDVNIIIDLLDTFAVYFTAQGETDLAARLFGAQEERYRLFHLGFAVRQRREHDEALAALRQSMGEAAFAAAFAEGQSQSLEQAVQWVMENMGA
jgi:predicted ATPase